MTHSSRLVPQVPVAPSLRRSSSCKGFPVPPWSSCILPRTIDAAIVGGTDTSSLRTAELPSAESTPSMPSTPPKEPPVHSYVIRRNTCRNCRILRSLYDWTLFVDVLSFTHAIRTVAFQNIVESVPFFTANTRTWPSLSLYSLHIWFSCVMYPRKWS